MRRTINQYTFTPGINIAGANLDIFNCNAFLQQCSQVVVDFVFLLSQIPRGICFEDIGHFKVLWPDFFGNEGDFLEYVIIDDVMDDEEEI